MDTESKILHNIIANQNIYLMFYVWTNEISLWAGLLRAMQHKICLVAMCSCLIVVRIIALTWKKLIVYYLIASHLVRTFLGSNSKLFFMLQYWIKYCGNNIFEQTQTWKMYIKSWLHAFENIKTKALTSPFRKQYNTATTNPCGELKWVCGEVDIILKYFTVQKFGRNQYCYSARMHSTD